MERAKKGIRRGFWVTVLLVAAAGPMWAKDRSAVSAGLAGVVTADAIGPRSLWNNAGGLGLMKGFEVEWSHLEWLVGTSYDQFIVALPLGKGSLGVGLQAFHSLFDPENHFYTAGQESGRLNHFTGTLKAGYGMPLPWVKGLGVGAVLSAGVGGMDRAGYASSFGASVAGLYAFRLFPRLLPRMWRMRPVVAPPQVADTRLALDVSGLPSAPVVRPAATFVVLPFLKGSLETAWGWEDGLGGMGSALARNFGVSAEAGWDFGMAGLAVRGGYRPGRQDVGLGGGLRLNYGRFFYRLDYALNLGALARDVETSHWMTLSVGQSPFLVKYLRGVWGPLPERYYAVDDGFAPRYGGSGEEAVEARPRVRMAEVTTVDRIVKQRGYDREIALLLEERLKGTRNLDAVLDRPDALLTTELRREGELMMVVFRLVAPDTKAVLAERRHEVAVDFPREEMAPYDVLNLAVRVEGDRFVFLPTQEDRSESPDRPKLVAVVEEFVSWLDANVDAALTERVVVACNVPEVDVYGDGRWLTQTGPSGRAEFRLMRGRRTLAFVKPGYGTVTRSVVAEAGNTRTLDVTLEEGRFTAELEVVSYPSKAKVALNGVAKGVTPLVLSNVPAGRHKLTFTAGGERWEETVVVDRDGRYRVWAVRRLREGFKDLRGGFWTVVRSDRSAEVRPEGRLVVAGRTEDAEVLGNGLVSRLFENNEARLKVAVEMPQGRRRMLVGLVDPQGRGVAVECSRGLVNFVRLGKGVGEPTPALEIAGTERRQEVEIALNRNGEYEVLVGEMLLAAGRLRDGEVGRLRAVVLADADSADDESAVVVESLSLRN